MEYERKGKDFRALLAAVLPDKTPINAAPDMGELERRADALKLDIVEVVKTEREKRYKAIDGAGNVYLMGNPAAWAFTMDSSRGVRRPPQELVLDAAAAKKAAKRGTNKAVELPEAEQLNCF